VKDRVEVLEAMIEYLKRTEYGVEHRDDLRYDGMGQEIIV